MQKGFFICLEGIEGTGKTTQANLLYRYLKKNKCDILMTREPGGTVLAEAIRKLLLHPPLDHEPLLKETELLLIFAARAQHIQYCIQPALKQKKWIICDRFIEASYAYQGGGRKVSSSLIASLEKEIMNDITMDCVFLLDMPVPIALRRIAQRNKAHCNHDRIENETEAFFNQVRTTYLKRAKKNSSLYYIIDANQSAEAVHQQILKKLNALNAS